MNEYFANNRYKHTYNLGDRVRGVWGKIPFTGTVMIDTLVDEYDGPYIIVHSDLPIKDENGLVRTMIKLTHSDITQVL
jgi:hypothetical protein